MEEATSRNYAEYGLRPYYSMLQLAALLDSYKDKTGESQESSRYFGIFKFLYGVRQFMVRHRQVPLKSLSIMVHTYWIISSAVQQMHYTTTCQRLHCFRRDAMDIYYDLEPREDIGVCMGKRNKARTPFGRL